MERHTKATSAPRHLGYSCMQAEIGELRPQTCVAVAFLYTTLCVITPQTQKLKVVYGHCAYQTTALLSEDYFQC